MEPEHVWHRPDVDMKYLCFFLISMLLLSCSRQKRAETLFRGIQSDDYISESFHEVAVSAGKNITIHAGEFDSEGYCLMHELFDTVIQVTFFNRLIINCLHDCIAYNMPTFLIYYRLFLT